MRVISDTRIPIKAWVDGVELEEAAEKQLRNVASLPCVGPHVAVMPDVHWGNGATVGSVIPTTKAIIPAAVGVDIGCGMMAVKLDITASQLPDSLAGVRSAIEAAVPHGRTDNGGRNDRGAWGDVPDPVVAAYSALDEKFLAILAKYPKLDHPRRIGQLGTLGTGNHFIEVCTDTEDGVWVMLHSGSRGVGNSIGSFFIEKAKREMERWFVTLSDTELAYLAEGSTYFDDYVTAVGWAQEYAKINRELMMAATLRAIAGSLGNDSIVTVDGMATAINCHHNYIAREYHFGKNYWITRKGAVRARGGDLGIIPGSMGAKSFIVRGKGNPQSFHSCSHGAGRRMSRGEAKRRFTVEDHAAATVGVECRKDDGVIDETPAAYKSIDAVMAAQSDLVEIVATLKQVLCVKG